MTQSSDHFESVAEDAVEMLRLESWWRSICSWSVLIAEDEPDRLPSAAAS